MRINSARDDAAGLAISTRLQSQIRGLNQSVRNTNDGISLAQTVESALEETGNILQRIRQLAVQAANDSNSPADREFMDTEVQHLIEELDRIGATTMFNGQRVLDGTFVESFFHVGANARETVRVSIRDARATALGRAAIRTTEVVTTAALSAGGVAINGISLRATVASDDTVSTTLNTSSALAKAAAINDSSSFTGVKARVLTAELRGGNDIVGGTLDAQNYVVLNGQTITGFAVDRFDADDELLNQINAFSAETGVVASLDENNRIVLTAQDGRNIEVITVGNAHLVTGLRAAAGTSVALGAIELSSDHQFSVAGADNAVIGIPADPELVGVTAVNSVSTVNVLDREQANRTLEVVDRALQQVSRERAVLGALQNRLESTINNLTAIAENVSAANSRILDADFAEETAALTRNQIIQQAGISILAAANQAPEQALALLG